MRRPLILALALGALLAGCGDDAAEDEPALDREQAEEVATEFYVRVSAGDEAGACELAVAEFHGNPCRQTIGNNLSDLRGKADSPEVTQAKVVGQEGATIVAGVAFRGDGFDYEALLEPDESGSSWVVGDFNVYYD